jgi:DNA invertase Pin-like site-specific DNA recombinase
MGAAKWLLDTLGLFAEFETTFACQGQLGGIAKAKAAGVYKEQPGSIDAS